VEQRLAAEVEAARSHPVQVEPCGGRLQRPRFVRHSRGDQPAAPQREEPVALDEEVFERARAREPHRAAGLIRGCEARVTARAHVVRPGAVGDRRHPCQPVRQPEQRPARADEERARGVEAEEPHAGHAARAHIRADVQLRDRSEYRPPRSDRRSSADHPERDDREPRLPIPHVGLEPAGKAGLELVRVDRPVGEEKIAPALREKPTSRSSRYDEIVHF